jgi:hypothetical protein
MRGAFLMSAAAMFKSAAFFTDALMTLMLRDALLAFWQISVI